MLRRVLSAAAAVAVLSVAAGNVVAATITGSLGTYNQYDTLNVSDGATDWAIYGGLGVGTSGSATDFTYGLSSPSFSALSKDAGNGPFTSFFTGGVKFAHSDGFGTYPAATTGGPTVDAAPIVVDSNSLAQLSFTHTLIGSEETLKIFVFTKQGAQQWFDWSASIGSDSYSVENQAVPVQSKANFGIVNLTVSGNPGDVLLFTVKTNYSNNLALYNADPVANASQQPMNWWGIGLGAASVTVTAVPEPASMALLGLGALALIRRRRA